MKQECISLLYNCVMSNLDAALLQLKQERDRLNEAIAALEAVTSNGGSRKATVRVLSPEARRRIAAAQTKRWAAFRKQRRAA